MDENHWDNFRYVYHYISDVPRPINHVKTYGSEKAHGETGIHDTREKFLRSIIGGAASMRFHRPTAGIGLDKAAQTTLRMVRRLEAYVKLWELEVHMELLEDRESDEAILPPNPVKNMFFILPVTVPFC